MMMDISFRKSDAHIAPGELSVLIRRQAARRYIGCFGIPLVAVFGSWELPVVPSRLTIRSVRACRVHDELPGEEVEDGMLSLHLVDKGLLYLQPAAHEDERYRITMEIDALDVELEDGL